MPRKKSLAKFRLLQTDRWAAAHRVDGHHASTAQPLDNNHTSLRRANTLAYYHTTASCSCQMKILSTFTHPEVVPNLYECLCSVEHKGRYSEKSVNQSSSGAPLTSIVSLGKKMSYYGSQRCPKTAWLQTFFKIYSFVFGRTKKFIQVLNYFRVSKR